MRMSVCVRHGSERIEEVSEWALEAKGHCPSLFERLQQLDTRALQSAPLPTAK